MQPFVSNQIGPKVWICWALYPFGYVLYNNCPIVHSLFQQSKTRGDVLVGKAIRFHCVELANLR